MPDVTWQNELPEHLTKRAESIYPLDEWFSSDNDSLWGRFEYGVHFDVSPQSFMAYLRTKAPLWDRDIQFKMDGKYVWFCSFPIQRVSSNGTIRSSGSKAIPGKVEK